jgi:hypothetical protein
MRSILEKLFGQARQLGRKPRGVTHGEETNLPDLQGATNTIHSLTESLIIAPLPLFRIWNSLSSPNDVILNLRRKFDQRSLASEIF